MTYDSGDRQPLFFIPLPLRIAWLIACTAVLWSFGVAAFAQPPVPAASREQSSIQQLRMQTVRAVNAFQDLRNTPAAAQDAAKGPMATLDDALTQADGLLARVAAGDDARGIATTRLLWLTGMFILLAGGSLLFLAFMVQRKYWGSTNTDSDANWRMYLMQLPLGAPEGSVRALVSIYVIVFGLLVLVMQSQLGLTNVDVIAGFVGIVITFYFTARTNDQAAKAVNSAVDAANKATTQVQAVVTETQKQVGSMVASANAAQQSAAIAQDAARAASQAGPVDTSSPAVTDAQSALQSVKGELRMGMQVLDALSSLGVGSGIITGAQDIAKTAGGLIDVIDPLLSGKPDGAKLAEVSEKAQDVLRQLDNAGLPGALGDAVAGIAGTMGTLSPLLGGIAGGPAGIVTGLVMTGVKLLQQKEKFDAWKAALLRTPLNRSLMPATVDGTAALAALDPAIAPLMAKRLGTIVQGQATDLMRKVLKADTSGDPLPAAMIAAELFAPGEPLDLHDKFQSAEELAEAITEYRSGIVFTSARAQLQSSVDIPAVGDQQARSLDVGGLLMQSMKLAIDPRGASDLERIVYIVEALGKLGLGPDRLIAVIGSALSKGIGLSTLGRQQTDQHQ